MKTLTIFVITIVLLLPQYKSSANLTVVQQASSSQSITQLKMHSLPGEYVGDGMDYLYTPADGTFTAQGFDYTNDGQIDYVRLTFLVPNSIYWQLDFATNRLGTNLALGTYTKTERAVFANPGHPGMEVSGQGRGGGCGGRFFILEAKFDYTVYPARVVSFAAQFEQFCGAGLYGTIFYNYNPSTNLAVSPQTINGGQTASGTVSLTNPAPVGGAVVNLKSENPALVPVPPSVYVPESETSATFPIFTKIFKAQPNVVITATYGGVASTATLNVVYPLPTLTRLTMHSDPGDYIGGGRDYDFTDGTYYAFASDYNGDDRAEGISFIYIASDTIQNFDFDFTTRNLGRNLVPGFYPQAQRFPFEDEGHPGLAISGVGVGCNTLTGEFTILETTVDYSVWPPVVVGFAASFTQHCEGGIPALSGTIYYKYSPSQPPSNFDICLQDDNSKDVMQINSTTGEYKFAQCHSGFTMGGTGILTKKGNILTLQHNSSDRRVLAKIDTGVRKGTTSIQSLSQSIFFSIIDSNTANNTCTCITP